MSSSPPTSLGQYQIIREIARSNDIVYEAYDPLMNRRVAVKELSMPPGMTDAQKQDRISRFRREAQAAGTLNHRNIMTVYSFAEDAGRTFMAMEYLDGHTLRNEIDTKGFLPVDRAIEIAIEVLEGLGHAHSKGVIHRDIKPDNVQILSSGLVKITDFGIARLTFQPNLTMDGQVFGTPSYMSPEQVVGREIDARSDLFSVGVLLYEMIAGQKPFQGDSVVAITYAIMNKEPSQPTQAPWSLWQVLSRALDKSPQLRYASAADFIEALQDAQRQAQSGLMSSSPSGSSMTGSYSAATPAVYGAQNPYAAPPVAPPSLNPYAQPPSPYPTAYNPYQQAPQQVQTTPYGYGGYNQAQYPGGYQMPSMPPPGPIPVFYPPPPRQPLLKPDTVVFLKKLLLVTLIFGSLLALLLVMVNAVGTSIQHRDDAKHDTDIASQIANLDPRLTVEERIEKALQLRKTLPPGSGGEADHNIAVLYEEYAKNSLSAGDLSKAELSFKAALDHDGTNPSLQADLGAFYEQMSGRAADPESRAQLLAQAGQAWKNASSFENDASKRKTYSEGAARALFSAAGAMYQAGDDRRMVRQTLHDALDAAPNGSQIQAQIQDQLNQLGA